MANPILIASHRGAAGGNVPCNSLAAFEAALFQGADILEMDVIRSQDGTLMIFHNGLEPAFLGERFDIYQRTAAEIAAYPLRNGDQTPTEHHVPLLDEVLEQFKNRCLFNLDRCWTLWEHVIPAVQRHGMREQIILKSPPLPEYFDNLTELGPRFQYMPIFKQDAECLDALEASGVRHWGSELVFDSMESPLLQPETFARLRADGKRMWANPILYSYKAQLTAGRSDDRAVCGDPDGSWGELVDMGFDVLQTDWPCLLSVYLHSRGLHAPPMRRSNP